MFKEKCWINKYVLLIVLGEVTSGLSLQKIFIFIMLLPHCLLVNGKCCVLKANHIHGQYVNVILLVNNNFFKRQEVLQCAELLRNVCAHSVCVCVCR